MIDMNEAVFVKMVCKNENDLKAIAELLISTYPSHRFFSLYGEMGAGKTTFIKFICEALQSIDTATSPTFSIVNVYKTKNFTEIFHFDFYRLKSLEELYDIGYEDYFYSDSYCFAEWPEKVESLLPEKNVKIFIDVDHVDGSRIIRF
jgi:tRNA threonylcarbamoyladenosine biosynthesis protein TsaE